MNPQVQFVVSLIFGPIISVLLAYGVTIRINHDKEIKKAEQMARLTLLVQQLWVRVFKNGVIEGLNTGFLETNSPLRATLAAFDEHKDFVHRLREWYAAVGHGLKDLDLMVAIDSAFEKDLMALGLKHKLTAGAALASACFLVRPGMSLFDHQPVEEWENGDD